MLVLDSEGRVVRFNGACERLSGYTFAEVAGQPVWDVVIPPAEVERVRAAFADLQAGAYPNTFENHWVTRAGVLRLISWENTCLADDRGAVTQVIATGMDVTEARRGDDALHGIEAVGRLLSEQGPAQSALAELVPDVRNDSDYVSGEGGVVAEIAAPLLGGEATLGVLNIESARSDGLTPEDLRLARAIADRLSSALRRSQTQEALRDRVRLFAALAEFGAAVNAIREPGRLAAALATAVGSVVPSDTAVITLLDRRDGQYRVSAVRGLAPGAVGAVIAPGDGTAGRAIAERAIVLTEPHPRAQSSPALRDYLQYETIRTVGVPLINEDTVLGVITVGRFKTDAPFTQAEREVFALLGSHAALALANAYLAEEVAALAIHAPAGSLAAIMFDLDHFGDFNRSHGHLAGDALLRLFGEILRVRLRSADIVARYGGEEFVAILEDCGLPEATRRADEVRRELEGRSVPDADGRPLRSTVSAGCAVMYTDEPTKDALIGRADAALFMAKEAGRNRVVGA